jgi:3-hydroxyacyl-CoA dehydrogenase
MMSSRAMPDPQVDELVRKWVQEAGITQRQIAAPEIMDRCIYALRASDIDIIYLNGYGFPAHRGGRCGMRTPAASNRSYERVSESHRQHGGIWRPAPLLSRISARKKEWRRRHHSARLRSCRKD